MQWDSEENQETRKKHLDQLIRGCGCKSGCNKERFCKCLKAGNKCGAGCNCCHCENTATVLTLSNNTIDNIIHEEVTEQTYINNNIQDEIIEEEVIDMDTVESENPVQESSAIDSDSSDEDVL